MKTLGLVLMALLTVSSSEAMSLDGLSKLGTFTEVRAVEAKQMKDGYVLNEIKTVVSDQEDDETLILVYKNAKESSFRMIKIHAMGLNDGSAFPAVSTSEAKF